MKPPPLFATATLAAALVASPAVHAQTRDVHLTMLGSPWWDVGYVAVGAGMALGGLALRPPTVDVAPLDGLGHRDWNPTVGAISDGVLYGGMGVMLGLGVVVERWGRDARGLQLLRAPLIVGESALMALGVVSLLKNAVGECRPRAWDDVAARCASAEREEENEQLRDDPERDVDGRGAPACLPLRGRGPQERCGARQAVAARAAKAPGAVLLGRWAPYSPYLANITDLQTNSSTECGEV